MFYATIVWSIGYWIVYPSWPLVSSYTTGMFNWHSRERVVADLEALKAQRGADGRQACRRLARRRSTADPQLLDFARAQGRPPSATTARLPRRRRRRRQGLSQPQRRRMALGRQARRHRTDHPPRHPLGDAKRPPGQHAGLRARRHAQARRHRGGRRLRALARRPAGRRRRPISPRGKKVFADNCAACHGDDGKGKRELGAPNLTDADLALRLRPASIIDGIWNGRGGVMPAWAGRLDDPTIKALTVYVHTLGGGEK